MWLEYMQVWKVVKQNCLLLFNMYLVQIINLCKQENFKGFKIGSEEVNMIRFADDIGVNADNGQ